MSVTILTFYRFHPHEAQTRVEPLRRLMRDLAVKGTIILAPEGINATIAGTEENTRALVDHIRSWPGFEAMEPQRSHYSAMPFGTARVKLRKELISLGLPADPTAACGRHVPPSEWNALINDPATLLIDGRNSYEARVGKFRGAVDLGAADFKDFPALLKAHLAEHPAARVAMYCTGGIRCEKLSAHLLAEGIDEVHQLDGGILHYLAQVSPEENRFEGQCYVFDGRGAVGMDVAPTEGASFCPACGHPANLADLADPLFFPGIRCRHCS